MGVEPIFACKSGIFASYEAESQPWLIPIWKTGEAAEPQWHPKLPSLESMVQDFVRFMVLDLDQEFKDIRVEKLNLLQAGIEARYFFFTRETLYQWAIACKFFRMIILGIARWICTTDP